MLPAILNHNHCKTVVHQAQKPTASYAICEADLASPLVMNMKLEALQHARTLGRTYFTCIQSLAACSFKFMSASSPKQPMRSGSAKRVACDRAQITPRLLPTYIARDPSRCPASLLLLYSTSYEAGQVSIHREACSLDIHCHCENASACSLRTISRQNHPR